MKRNVTLALNEETVRKARYLAVEKGVSLSRLLAGSLEQIVTRNEQYVQARKQALARMKRGLPMGMGRQPGWSRDELHER